MLKPELYNLIKEVKTKHVKYVCDSYAEEMGHRVIRLPPYHCEFNPIELIWENMKGQVARNNTTSKISDVKNLCEEAVAKISVEDWVKCCDHVVKEKQKMWETDGMVDNIIDQFIINPNESDKKAALTEISQRVNVKTCRYRIGPGP